MTEINTELRNRLVASHKRDGRCMYDRQAKQELVQECMKPGVSVSRMAMQYGVNANLLRKWIDAMALQEGLADPLRLPRANTARTPAFVQIEVAKHPVKPEVTNKSVHMQARLPNGVELEFGQTTPQALREVIHLLSTVPCSS